MGRRGNEQSPERCAEFQRRLGRVILDYRAERGVSLGAAAKMSGLSGSAISMIEAGERPATVLTLLDLLYGLDAPQKVFDAIVDAHAGTIAERL